MSHYRLIWPALTLAAQGYDVRIVPPTSRDDEPTAVRADVDQHDRVHRLRVPDDAEAVVFQRVTHSYLSQGVAWLAEHSPVAVIVDMDDDLRTIDPANPAFAAMHPKQGYPLHTGRNATNACLAATLVTVSAPALLRVYAPHGRRGVVLFNQVPRGFLDIPRTDSPVMSWPGSTHSHPNDLQQVGPAVARLTREGHRYLATGHPDGVAEALGLDGVDATGDIPHEHWPWAVSRIGVGLAPLADTAFNASKSWLKALEMSATGVPWVASPRAEYSRLHREHKVGLLAKDPKDWYRLLRRLVSDPDLRAEQSAAGRAAAAANTYEGNAWRWAAVWDDAVVAAQRRAALVTAG